MPVPVSRHVKQTYSPARISNENASTLSSVRFGRFDLQFAAIRHRIARVDAKIEKCVFQLVRIDQRRPEIWCVGHRHLDFRTERVVDEVRHAFDQPVYVRCFRVQRLAPGKGQKPMRQRSGTIGRTLRRRDVAFDILVTALRYPDLQQLERPEIPVSRLLKSCASPPGKLAYRLHLLGLPQCVFRLVERVLLAALLGDIASHAIE